MNQYPIGILVYFHSVYGPSITHEYQDYQVDLKDHLASKFGLIGEIIHKGYQANVLAAEEMRNGFYNGGQYSWRTF